MTLLGKKKEAASISRARWATLDLVLEELLKTQQEQNILFRDMIKANKEFVNVISNFFAIEKKLRIEDAMRREKKEQDFDISPGDLKY